MGVLEIKGPRPEDILGFSTDWKRNPPSESAQSKVAAESNWRWSPASMSWESLTGQHIAGLRGSIEGSPFAEREQKYTYHVFGGSGDEPTDIPKQLIEPSSFTVMPFGQTTQVVEHPITIRARQEALEQYRAETLATRQEELRELAETDPWAYGKRYVQTAVSQGPISAFGMAGETITRPLWGRLRKETLAETGEREVKSFAEQELAIQQRYKEAPIETGALALLQLPIAYTTGRLFGIAGAEASLMGRTAGSYFSWGSKLLGAGTIAQQIAPPLIRGEYEKATRKALEILIATPFIYKGYKDGVRATLEFNYIKDLAKNSGWSEADIRKELKIAQQAGKMPRGEMKTFKSVVKSSSRMRGKVGDIIYKYVRSKGDNVVVGGSMAERTQISGAKPHDIDLYVSGDPMRYSSELFRILRNAGISVSRGKGAQIILGGSTLVDIHTLSHLESLQFYRGDITTTDGVRVMDATGQFYRKILGKYEKGQIHRFRKDPRAFDTMVKSVIKTGTLDAEQSNIVSSALTQYRVRSLKTLIAMDSKGYVSYGAPSYFKPSKTFVPLAIPFGYPYKPKKAPQIPKQYLGLREFKDYAKPKKLPKYPKPRGRYRRAGYTSPPEIPSLTYPKLKLPDYKYTPPPPPIIPPPYIPPPSDYYRPPPPDEREPPGFRLRFPKPTKRRKYKKLKPPKMPKKYTPSLTGLVSGKFITKPPKGIRTGLGVRYPVRRTKMPKYKMLKFKPPKLKAPKLLLGRRRSLTYVSSLKLPKPKKRAKKRKKKR